MLNQKIKKYAWRCEFVAWIFVSWEIIKLLRLYLAAFLPEIFNNITVSSISIFLINNGFSWPELFPENILALSWPAKLLILFFDGVAVGILLILFGVFIKLMQELKKGSVFSCQVINLLNRLATIGFWFALYIPINRSIDQLILTLPNPPGQRILSMTIGSGDILAFAVSWFFVILTSLMQESQQMQAERDLTI